MRTPRRRTLVSTATLLVLVAVAWSVPVAQANTSCEVPPPTNPPSYYTSCLQQDAGQATNETNEIIDQWVEPVLDCLASPPCTLGPPKEFLSCMTTKEPTDWSVNYTAACIG